MQMEYFCKSPMKAVHPHGSIHFAETGRESPEPVTSKEEILEVSRKIAARDGITAVNMRTVAAECGIALGSLYNYFVSKAELLSATVEAVWADIFPVGKISEDCKNIVDYLKILLESAEKSKERYPQFFSMHALSFAAGEKQEGRKTMEGYFQKIKYQMLRFIRNDEKIRPHIFTERLSKEVYVDYIFTLFLSILFDERADQEAFLEFVKNYLY